MEVAAPPAAYAASRPRGSVLRFRPTESRRSVLIRLGYNLAVFGVTACGIGPATAPHCECAALGGSAGDQLRLNAYEGEPTVTLLSTVAESRFVDVTDVERLSDGRVVVANTGRREIVFLDSRGRVLRAVGRNAAAGWDPRGAIFLGILPGDSVLAGDTRSDRLQMLSPGGDLVRSFAPPLRLSSHRRDHIQLVGVLSDGISIFTHTRVIGSDRADGVVQDSTEFARCSRGFHDCESLGWFLADEVALRRGADGFPRLDPVVGGVQRQVAVIGRDLIVTYGDGTPVLRVDVASGVRMESSVVLPPTVHIVGSEAANLWIRSGCATGGSRVWWVLDLETRQCGTVELPAAFSPHVIRQGYAVGEWGDSIGSVGIAELEWSQAASLTESRASR